MARKLTINDVIHFYLAHYCCDVQINGSSVSMWSEMNEILGYYKEFKDGVANCYSIEEILRMCVRGLYPGHQRRVKEQAVDEAVCRLFNGKFIQKDGTAVKLVFGKKSIWGKFCDFEELYEAVCQLIGSVNGMGYVTLYDTARRIGHLLEEPIYPRAYVYLHYNKVNWAARSIIKQTLPYRAPVELFLVDFGTFPSICIEDILCIFSDVFTKTKNHKEENGEDVIIDANALNWRSISLKTFIEDRTKILISERAKSPKRWAEFSCR